MLDSPLAPPWLVITSPQYFKECGLKYTTLPAKYITPSTKGRRCVVNKPFKSVIKEKYKYYTREEDAIIRKYYRVIGARACAEKLKGRSIQSVIKRARLLELDHGSLAVHI